MVLLTLYKEFQELKDKVINLEKEVKDLESEKFRIEYSSNDKIFRLEATINQLQQTEGYLLAEINTLKILTNIDASFLKGHLDTVEQLLN